MFVSYHSDFDKQIYGGFAFRQIDGFRKELPWFRGNAVFSPTKLIRIESKSFLISLVWLEPKKAFAPLRAEIFRKFDLKILQNSDY